MESIQVSKLGDRLVPELMREWNRAYAFVNEYSKLKFFSKTIEGIYQSLPAVMIRFKNPEQGGSDTFMPEVIHYTRSRLHPIWAWLARMVILSTWKNFIKLHRVNENYTLVYAQLYNCKDVSISTRAFKKIRQSPGWKRAIKGGQYAVELAEPGICIHAVLLGDRKCNADLLKRYTRIAWSKVQQGRPDIYPALCNGLDPLRDFQIGFINSFRVHSSTDPNDLCQIERLSPLYKFGCLNNEEELNYETILDETIKTLRAA